jgi:ribosome-binding factor A
VAQELRDRIAEILTRQVRDPRLELMTVTALEISPDLSFARVFYRTLGDRDAADRALRKAKPFIRRHLAEGLPLRRVPELDFRWDESADQAERVDRILDDLAREREQKGPQDGDAEGEGGTVTDEEGS